MMMMILHPQLCLLNGGGFPNLFDDIGTWFRCTFEQLNVNDYQFQSPDKETKYVVVGEKAKAQFICDSRKHIDISITELQKNPLNYTQKLNKASHHQIYSLLLPRDLRVAL
ncbi:uncharacterized protein LOC112035549 isoform X2 [Quercus suber]|uniref:uncharacterized protein LOC112035549 isoform X2 n=1 Tax=Quercus suber TaxID=58331 RepID=UPI0032DF4FEE